jgi:hypothetical protein
MLLSPRPLLCACLCSIFYLHPSNRELVQANKWKPCSWHVFAFHALMEWTQSRIIQQNTDDTAIRIVKKIFDHGASQAGVQSQPEYVHKHASWLVSAPFLFRIAAVSVPV